MLRALGVRTTGEKLVLGLGVAGDEQKAAWQGLLWGTLASGGIRLRKLHGNRTLNTTPLRHAA